MSITKAVIGLLFELYHRGDVHAKVYKNIELDDALNMRSGIVSPPFEDSYDEHKIAHDVTALCRGVLDKSVGYGIDREFSYNDFMYQLLPDVFSCEEGGLDDAFAHFMDGTGGWEWKKDGRGCVFAPNGLSMTKDVAVEFARRARPHVLWGSRDAHQVPPPSHAWRTPRYGLCDTLLARVVGGFGRRLCVWMEGAADCNRSQPL